jgi:hypothetical protein
LNPAIYLCEDAPCLPLDFDVVAKIFPAKGRRVLKLLGIRGDSVLADFLMRIKLGLCSFLVCSIWATGFAGFAKDQNLSFGGVGREELPSSKVGTGKEDDKPEENAVVPKKSVKITNYKRQYIPPHVSIVVLVDGSHIEVAIDIILAESSASNRTCLLYRLDIFIARARRYHCLTRERSSREFIGDQRLVTVCNWVDVVQPSKPPLHVSNWQNESSVDNQTYDDNSRRDQCLVDGLGSLGYSP